MKQLCLPRGRAKLSALVASSGDAIRIEHASAALNLSRIDAAKQLSRWVEQGWLRRVGRGVYVAAPIDSLASEQVLPDPWVLVPALFAPAYIGGRTAAEHWNLTEQVSNDIVVMTAQALRSKNQIRHGAKFTLRHVEEEKIFGTRSIWRGKSKITISDIHRTIIDMLDRPADQGGIQHVADCFAAYFRLPDRNERKLIEYGERLGNGAVFKRMGFLSSSCGGSEWLVNACQDRLTHGNAKLDPSVAEGRLVSKWRLWISKTWASKAAMRD